ncbi:MAG: hypothetical protein WCR92_07115, partial [Candidatus Cloacimonadaceae bacterium]
MKIRAVITRPGGRTEGGLPRSDNIQVDVIFIPSQHPHSEDPWHDFGTISAQKISTGVDAGKAREGQEPQER